MKPSHFRTPRTLSECYFEVGSGTIEPSMWRGQWDSQRIQIGKRKINWTLVAPIAIVCTVFVTLYIQSQF